MEFDLPTPLAFAGALAKQVEQIFDEHGISCLRYSSLTIFWTLPFFIDRTKILLATFEARGSRSFCLFKLVISTARTLLLRFFQFFVVQRK